MEDDCADLNYTTLLRYQQQQDTQKIQYLLLTRRNVDCAQTFDQESLNQENSFFNTSLPTKVIIHGYRYCGTREQVWTRLRTVHGQIDHWFQVVFIQKCD